MMVGMVESRFWLIERGKDGLGRVERPLKDSGGVG
jgi:hypothetical protein